MGTNVDVTASRTSTSYRLTDELENYGSSWTDDGGSGYRFYTRGTDSDGSITGTSN